MSCHDHCSKKNKLKCKKQRTVDWIIVGLGTFGCVVANELSKNPNSTVEVLEAGRDDARLPELLPEPSYANVPQPGTWNWGSYLRALQLNSIQESRGFLNEWFFLKQSADPNSRSISYPRVFGWSGCTAHNRTIAIRNAPYNFNNWGLPEWVYSKVLPYYFNVENRSQVTSTGQRYYDPAVPLPPNTSSDPNNPDAAPQSNTIGGFSNTYYGYSGNVGLLWSIGAYTRQPSGPPIITPSLNAMNASVVNVLNNGANPNNNGKVFAYPINVDLDYPPTAKYGGTSVENVTQVDQFGQIAETGSSVTGPFAAYNLPRYGDAKYVYPPELAPYGFVGSPATQRANATYNYIYSIQSSRPNLQIKSEVLATKILFKKKRDCDGKKVLVPKAVKYLEGWNIYQAGRNVSVERGGYGGTRGDARANAILSKEKGEKILYAKKGVILSAGFINTPQLLMLSGIGDAMDLASLGIKCKLNLPVGKTLLDNQEIFMIMKSTAGSLPAVLFNSFKPNPTDPYVSFEAAFSSSTFQSLEASDVTVQRGWVGTKDLGALDNTFVRNNPNNLLIDPVAAGNPYPPAVFNPARFVPVYVSPTQRLGMVVEQEENNRSKGFLKLTSKDPTVPPLIVANYFTDPQDQDDWMNVMMNNVFPMILGMGATTPATASATIKLISVQMLNGGSNYSNATSVVITDTAPGTGSGATGTAVISGGVITGVNVVTNGTGYTGPFNIQFVDTTGSGAFAVGLGSVDNLTLTNPGAGYTSAPIPVFSGGFNPSLATVPLPTQATASASLTGNSSLSAASVASPLNLLTPGSNYYKAPTVILGSFYSQMVDPAPYDFLKDGFTAFTSMSQIDTVKLKNYLASRMGGHHAGATCKMGTSSDPTAVCDYAGRVNRTRGLYCIDMSVVPVSIRWPNVTGPVIAHKQVVEGPIADFGI